MVVALTPFFSSSVKTWRYPNPESNRQIWLVPHVDSVNWQQRVAVLDMESLNWGVEWGPSAGQSFWVSTSSIQNIIFEIQQAMVWYSMPYGCNLRFMHTQFGQNSFKKATMDSSRQLIHEVLKTSSMWSLNAAIKSWTAHERSWCVGGGLLVNWMQDRMSLNLFFNMCWLQGGGPRSHFRPISCLSQKTCSLSIGD